ncbi:MAG: ribose-5-phosphate isomerase RpiA [Candidatus Thermoplasmatota archaeon]|nr:ribose-5-phosphate isomerase RpiA [Candidatus Thermoplasmatota archaeon]MEC8243100.1 ribose-5-phosphate isomerase RpiA [Candidatus Thermoplasmatota archaeon]MEC8249865.1 ribose-5-phosphate isomerase RpiA [Candidatus Thermoplasmatota archaeon]MEC8258700.1 ribose-5-phosphate isomerase RpiA [Candidatus Thermoplasmatota archaeon]MEC8312392.1 ribose-5-phosphate isomerase RpiA [Candidatus Thermoplasmatota archaeon]
MDRVELLKQQAGVEACKFVSSGMKVGLGTGSTVKYTVIELGRRIAEEDLQIVGVPTSLATEQLANKVGIPLVKLSECSHLDIVIDGADEFDSEFNLIKGGGAALLREKIVAQESHAMVVVADERKMVNVLGAFPLPIEITPFAHQATIRKLAKLLDCRVNCRMSGDNPVVTDNGNYIADAHCGPSIDEPIKLERKILNIAGVVQVGLFNEMCDVVVLANDSGVEILTNPKGRLIN